MTSCGKCLRCDPIEQCPELEAMTITPLHRFMIFRAELAMHNMDKKGKLGDSFAMKCSQVAGIIRNMTGSFEEEQALIYSIFGTNTLIDSENLMHQHKAGMN